MAKETIEEQAREIVASKLMVDKAEVVPTARLQDQLDADSLDLVEIVMELEEAFDITIPDDCAEGFTTVQDIYDYLNENAQK